MTDEKPNKAEEVVEPKPSPKLKKKQPKRRFEVSQNELNKMRGH